MTNTPADDGTYERAREACKTIPTRVLRQILRTGITNHPGGLRAIEETIADRAPDPEIDCMCDHCMTTREEQC